MGHNKEKDWTAPVFFAFVKTEACFSSKKKAESGAGKFAFDGKQIIVAHTNTIAPQFNLCYTPFEKVHK